MRPSRRGVPVAGEHPQVMRERAAPGEAHAHAPTPPGGTRGV
jgi:hypothetical protein